MRAEQKVHITRKKTLSARRALGLTLLLTGLLIAFALVYPRLYSTVAPQPVMDPAVVEAGYFWLVIPEINVDTVVLGEVSRSTLGRAVGHLPGSGFPGEGRNVIIVGHHFNPATAFNPKISFGLLDNLRKGSMIYLAYGGRVYLYEVAGKETLAADDPLLYADSREERLTLLTCAPFYHTTKRLKVFALPVTEK